MVTRDEILKIAGSMAGTCIVNLDNYFDPVIDQIASGNTRFTNGLVDVKTNTLIYVALTSAVNSVRALQRKIQSYSDPGCDKHVDLSDQNYRFGELNIDVAPYYYFASDVDTIQLVDDIVRMVIREAREQKAKYILLHCSEKYENCLCSIHTLISDMIASVARNASRISPTLQHFKAPIAIFNREDYKEGAIDESFVMAMIRTHSPKRSDQKITAEWAINMIDLLNPLFRQLIRNGAFGHSGLISDVVDDVLNYSEIYEEFAPAKLTEMLNECDKDYMIGFLRNVKCESPKDHQAKMASRTCGIINPDISHLPNDVWVMRFNQFLKKINIAIYYDNIDELFQYMEMIEKWLIHHPIGYVKY